MISPVTVLQTADWRQRVFSLYAQVRLTAQEVSPSYAHELWRAERDRLFAEHPASPLKPRAREHFRGLEVAPYDPDLRSDALIDDDGAGARMDVPTGTDGVVPFVRMGTVAVDGVGRLAVWRLASYGGGIFLPVRDALSGTDGGSYGGGRYLLDTIKGADLGQGAAPASLVLDFNFLYNPSCAYDEAWACPLPGPDNRTDVPLRVGEMYAEY
ncbi:DUF1684 domain-containing protein [Arthrobacter gengyunqii]|uniref:DUF1684 domain-containing protein n=1 Tax=Arthrobacter gengyunqii TaxID=2886940 RepID=A0A9X1S6V0_9MICC|nr:DUF1684 domain-containing protein [Arthrobacter gengyunqii]MCC3269516.1 DUF1684 domain-containing protein [Arthrobacter gengyunqii]MCC3270999.1 DUF1684 domain-containing protein [Arthrobacter gengyunqii]UOY96990.1 DUF1684 domain-containing protein [Arthrobacter gengyunqii]